MTQETAFEIYRGLMSGLPHAPGNQHRERISTDLDAYTALMPEPDQWTVQRGEVPTALLVSGDALFVMQLAVNGEEHNIAVESRPLNEGFGTVSLARGGRATREGTIGRETIWSFKFDDGTVYTIAGLVDDQFGSTDRAEEFARALAGRFGWSIPIRERNA